MITHEQAFELIPLYALDALEGSELAALEAHLDECDRCAEELTVHHSVAAGLVGDAEAPAHLWDRISSRIEDDASSAAEVVEMPARSRWSTRATWLTSIAAGLALVLAGVVVYQQQALQDITGPEGVVTAAERASEEPGSIVAELSTEEGVVAEVVLTADGEGFVIPRGLDPLQPDRTYQLWVITPDELVISAGVLGNDPDPARFTWNGEVVGFALTREVAGGVVSSAGDVVSIVEI